MSGPAEIYAPAEATDEVRALLRQPADEVGTWLGRGEYSTAYRVTRPGAAYVLKETHPDLDISEYEFEHRCGFTALTLNIALELGLSRIDEAARTLPNGARLTTPHYYGAYINPGSFARILMSYEPGDPVYAGDPRAGTHGERREIFDRALDSVGMVPPRFGIYDDIPSENETNLFARHSGPQNAPEIVMIDACNLIDF